MRKDNNFTLFQGVFAYILTLFQDFYNSGKTSSTTLPSNKLMILSA